MKEGGKRKIKIVGNIEISFDGIEFNISFFKIKFE
jgi:hypothetical protein